MRFFSSLIARLLRAREVIVHGLIFLAIGLMANPWTIQGGFLYDEGFQEYLPWRLEAARIVSLGEWPFFTDRIAGGMPLFSTGYAGTFYPINWLYLTGSLELLGWLGVFHTVLGGFGMRAYLRSWRLSQVAVFAGTIWFLTGTFLIHHTGHVSMREAALWAPWVAWAARTVLRRSGPRRAGIMALLLGLQISTGYLQIVMFTGLWVFLDWIIAFARTRRFAAKTTWLIVGGLTGFALLGLMILPTMRHAAQTERPFMSIESWQQSSFPPGHALLFFQPRAFGPTLHGWFGATEYPWEAITTVSPAAWSLALAAMGLAWTARCRTRLRSRAIQVFGAGIVLIFLLAQGRYFPLNALTFHIPPFSLFRIPSRWLFMASTFVSVLSAFAIHDLRPWRAWARVGAFGAGWAALGLIGVFLFLAHPIQSQYVPLPAMLLSQPDACRIYIYVACVGISLLFLAKIRHLTMAVILLAAILEFQTNFRQAIPEPENHVWPSLDEVTGRQPHPIMSRYPAPTVQRFFSLHPGSDWPPASMVLPNTNVFLGYRHMGGYSPMISQRMKSMLPLTHAGLFWNNDMILDNPTPLHVFGVTHVLIATDRMSDENRRAFAQSTGTDYRVTAEVPGLAMAELINAPPRVHFAAAWRPTIETGPVGRNELILDMWDPGKPMTERTLPIEREAVRDDFPPPNTPLTGGKVDAWAMLATRQMIRAETKGPGLLVIRDSYWQGWKYRLLNGTPKLRAWRDVIPVQGLVRGVPLPAGNWDVELRYFPPGWKKGKWVTAAAMAVLVLLLVGRRRRA